MSKKRRGEVVKISAELKELGRKEKWTARDAATIVETWRRSGSPLAAFARAMGVGEQRIRNWRDSKNKSRIDGPPSLVPVKVTGPMRVGPSDAVLSVPRTDAGRMKIELSRGRSIGVGVDFDAGAVARLVTTLEQLGC